MRFFPMFMASLGLLLVSCRSTDPLPVAEATLESLQERAKKFQSVLAVPDLETTPAAIQKAVDEAIARGNADLDKIGKLQPGQATFANAIRALDDAMYQASLAANRISLIKETSEKTELRDAATEAIKKFEEWAVGLDYREDVYAVVKAYEKSNPKLEGEDKKLFEEILRDYRRAGLELPKNQRQEVEQLRKDLSKQTTDFDSNVTKAQKAVKFTAAQLAGVPESFLKATRTAENEHTVMANITWHNQTVMENARLEETRKRMVLERYTLAREENVPVLKEILRLRNTIARKLGYASWADYKIEPKMAKTAKTAIDFLERLNQGLEPKFQAELAEFKKIKVRDTGNAQAKIELWDIAYYSNQLKKEKYTVDAEALRVYFPYDRVLQGMFRIYENIFALKIQELPAPAKWTESLKLYSVTDSRTGEPMGLFYLDMFPREGKYNHFAQFGIIEGKKLPSGLYQRPTVALICNFPPPEADKPSLLTHDHVETLFHEFGHAMHSILTRAHHSRFAGTSVPRDFVEAPSQMLENWVWDKTVLDSFAADYRDPNKKIPESILGKLKEAKLATIGSFYRRQLSFGFIDLVLHEGRPEGQAVDPIALSNPVFTKVLLPVPPDTTFVTYFGHLTGYDGGYYGYAWADAISADMATIFENAPGRYLDKKIGLKLRNEIYAPGNSRDVTISIEKFLGRPQSIEPFLKSIGIGQQGSAN